MAVPIVAGGLGLGLSKRAEKRKKQAATNNFSKKYPLSDDCDDMELLIKNANQELLNIERRPARTAAAKRVKKRDSSALRSWVSIMKDHLKDLKCGINVSSVEPAQRMEPVIPPAERAVDETTEGGTFDSVRKTTESTDSKPNLRPVAPNPVRPRPRPAFVVDNLNVVPAPPKGSVATQPDETIVAEATVQETSAMGLKPKRNLWIYAAVGVVVIGGLIYMMRRK